MIKDIQEEGKVSLLCLITKCDKGKTAKDTPYLSLILEDASGVLDAKFWNLTEEMISKYHVGMVVEAQGDIILHRNALQMRVRKLVEQPDEDISKYVRGAPIPREKMQEEINGYVESIQDEELRVIVSQVLEESENDFYTYPAATRNHHNYVGGLAYHTISMMRMAMAIEQLYDWLDHDLLVAGVLMHDIGKIEELSEPVLPEYTTAGNLIGHISLMASRIDRIAWDLGLQDSESVLLLKHMVLSHHGRMEFGSPVLPMIPEAEVLASIDNLDAKLFMMKASMEVTDPGHFGPKVFALENRMIYRRKDEKK